MSTLRGFREQKWPIPCNFTCFGIIYLSKFDVLPQTAAFLVISKMFPLLGTGKWGRLTAFLAGHMPIFQNRPLNTGENNAYQTKKVKFAVKSRTGKTLAETATFKTTTL